MSVAVSEANTAMPVRDRPDRRWKGGWLALVFLVPSLVIFGVFIFYPLVRTVILSLRGNDIFGRPVGFVGGQHFRELFSDPQFPSVLLHTLLFVIYTVVPSIVIAVGLGLLLQHKVWGSRIFRTAFALPFAFSVATAAVLWTILYNPAAGVLNGLLGQVGAGPVRWLTSPAWALPSVAAAAVWMALGYNMLVVLAGLGTIPADVIEAAELDGATGWRLVRSVTLPLITPQIFFLVVTGTITALQNFGQINILTKGGPAGATTTLVYSIYNQAFAYNASDFGYASAQAIVLLAVVLVVTGLQFGVLERRVFYS